MNLLPKSSDEFATKEYWNKFFQKRGKTAFDWYGEFPELCGILSKYVKTKDTILMAGCGNSKLSIDLYKTGYSSLTNIDISEVVIEQMRKTFPRGVWQVMDATKMAFDDEHFSVIFDKGTLDAMLSEDSSENYAMVESYFNEIKRTLRNGGRYVCVSLLQEHILSKLLTFFPENNFLFRIVRCLEAEEVTASNNEDGTSMPVFMIVATKFLKLPNKIYEFSHNGETIERVADENSLTDCVLTIQRASILRNGLIRKSVYEDEITFDLFRPSESNPRYSLFILDQKGAKITNPYAAMICPQGRECEWLFASKQGRRKLLETAQFSRLAIVVMHRNQTYTTLDDIKVELNETVKSFAPKGVTDMSKIPFLSLGSDIGERKIVHEGTSAISGDFVVEDVMTGNETYRRLIFLKNRNVIQSEALMKSVKKKMRIDHSYLSCQHHIYMILGILMTQDTANLENLVIGLGGGGLISYIYHHIKALQLSVVEIDPEIVKIAQQYFGLVSDPERVKIIINDGLLFLKSSDDQKYQSILFDVDSKDQTLGISCPPKEFLTNEVLNAVKSMLPSSGIFIMNFVCRDDESRSGMLADLRKVFPSIFSYKLDEDVNEIFYCFKEKVSDYEERFKKAAKKLNANKRDLVDLSEVLKNLKLQ